MRVPAPLRRNARDQRYSAHPPALLRLSSRLRRRFPTLQVVKGDVTDFNSLLPGAQPPACLPVSGHTCPSRAPRTPTPAAPTPGAAMEGATAVIFAAAGNKWAGRNSPYDVDYLARATPPASTT